MFSYRFSPVSLVFALAISVSLLALPTSAIAQEKALEPSTNPTAVATEEKSANSILAEGQTPSTTGDAAADNELRKPISDPSARTVADSSPGSSPAAPGTTPSSSADPATTTSSAPDPGTKKSSFGRVLKSNIIETFELDPRLKKDLTEGDPILRPIKLIQDNFAIGYNPTITWERDAGPPWMTSYNTRAMTLYLAGPVTKHLSGWFQMLPQEQTNGFFPKFEMFQGMANYGTDKTFLQIRGGQSFNWQNAGFGGADRTVTQTSPGVYTPLNGFDPTAVSKTISAEVTGLNWTTGKVFGYWQPSAGDTTADPNITYASRGEGVGVTFEKLFGTTGISGIQSNLTMGNTRAFNANTDDNGCTIGGVASPFTRWTSWVNKSFQDKKGYVRLNPSFGLTVFRQRRFLDDPSVEQNTRTNGYGYTFDLLAIPVRSYWTTILRYDQFKADRLASDNTTYTFTVGQAFDFHTPNKGRIRVTFDYQLVGQHASAPSHRIILGFWPIW